MLLILPPWSLSQATVTLVGHMPESSDREEFGKSNLCFPDSCSVRRQPAEPGTARPTSNRCRIAPIRRLRGLQSIGLDSRREDTRQQLAVGTADRQPAGAGTACRQPKGTRGACDCSPRPPWNPLTLSNAVPWFSSEVDTFLASQLLAVNGRRGDSN